MFEKIIEFAKDKSGLTDMDFAMIVLLVSTTTAAVLVS